VLWQRSLRDLAERDRLEESLEQETALRKSDLKYRVKAKELEEALQELQQAQAHLVQSEKMSSLGQLVAGIAHEINNPVSFISGNVKYLKQEIPGLLRVFELYQQHYPNPVAEIAEGAIDLEYFLQDLPKLLSSMQSGSERIQQIVLSLRNFSRLDEADMKQVDIHEGIDSALLILQSRLNAHNPAIQVLKDYGTLPLVECYPGQLNQVLMNLLVNGIDALDNSGGEQPQIHIRTETLEHQQIAIRIANNGAGIPEEVKLKLFDPFFTTKPVGQGTGMGLAISYQIVVEKHQGQLLCVSETEKGAEFVVQIPISQNPVISR
jgi:two-component system, NtrC family, sensor kinase